MSDFETVREKALADLAELKDELWIVYEELVLPNWGTEERHGFPRTLFGYVMNTFAFVDLLSQDRSGSTTTNKQTLHMTDLMVDYGVSPRRAEAKIAINLWRHKLMHTGNPQAIVDRDSGRKFRWLLHWESHLPRIQHMTFTTASDAKILNLGAAYLVEDLMVAARQLFTDLATSSAQRARVEAVSAQLEGRP